MLWLCVQLQRLRDQSKHLQSHLQAVQCDITREEQDLNVLCIHLQQMKPEAQQYVCVAVTSENL